MPAVWHTSNTDPVIWKSEETVQTLDGIPGCLVRFDYRVSRNSTMDVRFYIDCPVPPTSFSFTVTPPSAMPKIEPGPLTTVGVYGPVVASGGPVLRFYTSRLTVSDLVMFQSDDDSTVFEGSLFATVTI